MEKGKEIEGARKRGEEGMEREADKDAGGGHQRATKAIVSSTRSRLRKRDGERGGEGKKKREGKVAERSLAGRRLVEKQLQAQNRDELSCFIHFFLMRCIIKSIMDLPASLFIVV